MNKLYLKAVVKKDEGKITVIASNSSIDRQGESIDQKGWDLTNFLKNPIMLWAHNYDELPLGVWDNIRVTDRGLEMDANFASKEANPKAENVRLLVEEGIEKTVSVGFIPQERDGHIITKAELLEVSFVPVPANPEALALAMSKGLDADFLNVMQKEQKEFCLDCGQKLEDGDRNERKTDKEDVIELVCNNCIKERVNTKPAICEPDSPDYDPEACGALFCDPQSAEYNQEFCDLMKAIKEKNEKISLVSKSGRVISEKNRVLIKDAVLQFEKSISILQELLKATDAPEKDGVIITLGEGDSEKDRGSNGKNGNVELSADLLKSLLTHSRQADKSNELVLRLIKGVLKNDKKEI